MKFILTSLAAITLLFSATPALAQVGVDCSNAKWAKTSYCDGAKQGVTETVGENTVLSVLRTVVTLLSILVGIAAVIGIIIGAFTFVTSNGSAEKVTKGKNIIIYSFVGLIGSGMAWAIVSYVLTLIS